MVSTSVEVGRKDRRELLWDRVVQLLRGHFEVFLGRKKVGLRGRGVGCGVWSVCACGEREWRRTKKKEERVGGMR